MVKSSVAAFASLLGLLAACGSSSRDASFTDESCSTESTRSCVCSTGETGTAACSPSTGRWSNCSCTDSFKEAGTSASASTVCGDGACGVSETCGACPDDCGECAKCGAAPSCTDAVGTPTSTTLRADLCIDESGGGGTDAGTSAEPNGEGCGDAQLRIRLASVKTNSGGSTVYCVVNASDGISSEVALTVKTKALEDGETYYFDPAIGTLWGQKSLQKTTNNLTLTYNCFRVKSDSWSKVLSAASDAATDVSGVAGAYGWAFGLGAVGAEVAAAAISASSGDELVFNAQQTIARDKLLDLTNARSWKIRKAHDGGFLGWDWDWELTVESWGCADGTLPPAR